jgi:hypothetical protein
MGAKNNAKNNANVPSVAKSRFMLLPSACSMMRLMQDEFAGAPGNARRCPASSLFVQTTDLVQRCAEQSGPFGRTVRANLVCAQPYA